MRSKPFGGIHFGGIHFGGQMAWASIFWNALNNTTDRSSPETLLFTQSSNSAPLSVTSSGITVLSENAVTVSEAKCFAVGVRTWNGTRSPHFSWALLAIECNTLLHCQILVLSTRKALEFPLAPGWWKHGHFVLSLWWNVDFLWKLC